MSNSYHVLISTAQLTPSMRVYVQAFVAGTLFLRTNLKPNSIAEGGLYFGFVFFSLIIAMFDGFAEETLTVCPGLRALHLARNQRCVDQEVHAHGHGLGRRRAWS